MADKPKQEPASETDEPTQVVEQEQVKNEKPVAETAEDESFDLERAMGTIRTLRQENKDMKTLKKRLAEFEAAEQKRKQAEMTEVERLTAQLSDAEKKLKHAEWTEMVRGVAEEFGIPATLALRLQGQTEEELRADAENFSKMLKTKQAPTLPATNPANTQKPETNEEKKTRLLARPQPDPFSITDATAMGGGVLITKE